MFAGDRCAIVDGGYAGTLYRDAVHPSVLSAFDTGPLAALERVVVGLDPADRGTSYIYVGSGAVTASDRHGDIWLRPGMFAVSPEPIRLDFDPGLPTKVVSITRVGYRGQRVFGGPIEERGRLRYIDTCSDTCLVAPSVLGEPCLNHLHFPEHIEQTFHTHPSLRAGLVARGHGWCESGGERIALRPGSVWIIPTDVEHRFLTTDETLDVIAFHPDSDFGPTHEDHPMLNRTWVGGVKIQHDERAEVIDPYF